MIILAENNERRNGKTVDKIINQMIFLEINNKTESIKDRLNRKLKTY
jgi:hypothetical protein